MPVTLLFKKPPNNVLPVRLLFGEIDAPPSFTIAIAGILPGLTGNVVAAFDPAVPEYSTRSPALAWSDGAPRGLRTASAWSDGDHVQATPATVWRDGDRVQATPATAWRDAAALAAVGATAWRDGAGLAGVAVTAWRDGAALDAIGATAWRDADDMRRSASTSWRDGASIGTDRRVAWRDGTPWLRARSLAWRTARAAIRADRLPWRDGLGVQSSGGSPIVVAPPEPPDPCYIPPNGLEARLIFADPPSGTRLVFFCTRHPVDPTPETIVVPVRSVYIVLNTVTLIRIAGAVPLRAFQFSMTLDVDSWTWSWSATLAGSDLALIDDDPVTEVIASINGQQFRLLIESITRERTFGRNDLRVSGRGRNALLDVRADTFSQASARTVAQLMDEALAVNGVGVGWTVDFDLEDWLVPGGLWSHQGTPMSALRALAAAGGGYVQPHPTGEIVRVLPRYPVAPWNWLAEVTPDYELPAAATTREGIEWIKRPDYNRVFVTGTRNGVLGQITRTGTAGDELAPMVTDALITAAAAARQRGLSVLGDTGAQAIVSLRTLVFPETGIITPGKFVRYVDGATTRLGIVRRTQVDTTQPSVAQTLEVETHV